MVVFLFCHHPLSSAEFAKPFEQLRLLDVIRDHNAVLLLMGHGHGVRHEQWDTLDSVMGGETFRKNVGYNIVSVIDGTLRVVYRYQDPERGMQVLMEKSIHAAPGPSLEVMSPDLPRTGDNSVTPELNRSRITVRARVAGRRPESVVATVDDDQQCTTRLEPVNQRPRGDKRVYVADLEGAFHATDRSSGKLLWSERHATFSIEQPLLLHDGVLYGGAWDGFLYAVQAADGSLKWKARGPAAHRDETFILSSSGRGYQDPTRGTRASRKRRYPASERWHLPPRKSRVDRLASRGRFCRAPRPESMKESCDHRQSLSLRTN